MRPTKGIIPEKAVNFDVGAISLAANPLGPRT